MCIHISRGHEASSAMNNAYAKNGQPKYGAVPNGTQGGRPQAGGMNYVEKPAGPNIFERRAAREAARIKEENEKGKRCSKLTNAGEPCTAWASENGVCFGHNPRKPKK